MRSPGTRSAVRLDQAFAIIDIVLGGAAIITAAAAGTGTLSDKLDPTFAGILAFIAAALTGSIRAQRRQRSERASNEATRSWSFRRKPGSFGRSTSTRHGARGPAKAASAQRDQIYKSSTISNKFIEWFGGGGVCAGIVMLVGVLDRGDVDGGTLISQEGRGPLAEHSRFTPRRTERSRRIAALTLGGCIWPDRDQVGRAARPAVRSNHTSAVSARAHPQNSAEGCVARLIVLGGAAVLFALASLYERRLVV